MQKSCTIYVVYLFYFQISKILSSPGYAQYMTSNTPDASPADDLQMYS